MAPLKVVPLSSKSGNSQVWSGEQMVAEFLADIQRGKIAPTKMMILWFSEDPDTGRMRPHRWFAQMNSRDEIALLELAQHMAIEDWKS